MYVRTYYKVKELRGRLVARADYGSCGVGCDSKLLGQTIGVAG